jgi:hypothetical protein
MDIAPEPTPDPEPQWYDPAESLYARLLCWAAEEYPDSLADAFKRLCVYARWYVDTPRFHVWASDFRRGQEAATLRVLARINVDDFVRKHEMAYA